MYTYPAQDAVKFWPERCLQVCISIQIQTVQCQLIFYPSLTLSNIVYAPLNYSPALGGFILRTYGLAITPPAPYRLKMKKRSRKCVKSSHDPDNASSSWPSCNLRTSCTLSCLTSYEKLGNATKPLSTATTTAHWRGFAWIRSVNCIIV